MADSPGQGVSVTGQNTAMPYLMTVVTIFLLGVVAMGLILWLRPQFDPLIVVTTLFGFVVTITASVLGLMKSQETHLTVNSQLTAWKAEHSRMDKAEGQLQGAAEEQDRMVEVNKVRDQQEVLAKAQATASVAPAAPVAAAPLPVAPSIVQVKDLSVEADTAAITSPKNK